MRRRTSRRFRSVNWPRAPSGSLPSLLRWWLDRGEKESPHRMVWTGLQSMRLSPVLRACPERSRRISLLRPGSVALPCSPSCSLPTKSRAILHRMEGQRGLSFKSERLPHGLRCLVSCRNCIHVGRGCSIPAVAAHWPAIDTAVSGTERAFCIQRTADLAAVYVFWARLQSEARRPAQKQVWEHQPEGYRLCLAPGSVKLRGP